jgi:predicted CXXCH cytochrome family protein
MTLDIDSSICNECHDETAAQWQGTMHAQANVQCIGCHKAHSQTLRLTDDELCVTCHKEPVQDEFHSAHWDGAVSCVECHMAAPGAPAGSDPALAAPVHDFVHVSAQQCLDCHKEDVVSSAPRPAAAQLAVASPKLAESTTLLAASLDTATQRNQFLLLLGPVLLGVGVGGGGILGIVFMLVAGRLESRKRDAAAAARQDAEEDL